MLFPVHKTEITTDMTAKEVYLTLKTETVEGSYSYPCLMFREQAEPFIGEIGENSFSIVKYRCFHNNALNPVVHGMCEETGENTKIKLEFHLRKADKIGFSVFAGAYFLLLIFVIVDSLLMATGSAFTVVVIMLAVAAIGYGIFAFLWKWNVLSVLKRLKTLLK